MIEYATLIDEIAKEMKKNTIGLKTKQGTQLNTLLWMDDVCLIHHDLTTWLQQMLDITNHVAKKYHIEFGAAKCKVVKIGPGPKSKITLNNTTLEEVLKYKYLGKIYNSKGNIEEHLKETENKITAALQKILSETGDKEFKGMRMKAIWQCIEATIVPIMTYSSESWDPTKKEEEQIQKIFNTAIKTTMNLPQRTPTTILLKETWFISMKHEINMKRIMQTRRVEEKTERSLIKDNTTGDSKSMKKTMEIMEQYHLQRWPQTEKRSTKENNQTKNQREVGRGNKNGERRKN